MSSTIKYIVNNKGKILLIMFSPAIMYTMNVVVNALFNSGTYLGTFIRNLFSMVG
jgi:hypothetical protein